MLQKTKICLFLLGFVSFTKVMGNWARNLLNYVRQMSSLFLADSFPTPSRRGWGCSGGGGEGGYYAGNRFDT
jgi:hypothetical protein